MEDNTTRDEWVQSPYTEELTRDAERMKREYQEKLLLLCKTSSDSAIASAYSIYRIYQQMSQMLRTGTVPV